ncbi:DUF3515 domain-containing protein [Nocardia transvalensis]|uniref:DUF3515 domain-containing protein n=1 Tax=Nocardia transvalensis TaxID=37333 RepID=UPI0018959C34|nr:DUF3515 domain-containing protein [Nocardia transvalensis]MBF6329268.1 DUF3515 domain-containing protein [Nocardia transvalensis]
MSNDTDRPDADTAGDTADRQDDAATSRDAKATSDRYGSAAPESPKMPAALIATAVALPVALIVAVLVIAVMSRQHTTREPLALGSVPSPGATGQACTALLPALPDKVGDYTRAELAQPAPPATVAWQLPDGGDPIVLRCGLDRPLEFVKGTSLQVVNGVNWFEVRDQTSGVTSGTWFAVDRGSYIAVTMPHNTGPTPLQDISNAITKVLPEQPLDPGPAPN